jgi:hypothetical protein
VSWAREWKDQFALGMINFFVIVSVAVSGIFLLADAAPDGQ